MTGEAGAPAGRAPMTPVQRRLHAYLLARRRAGAEPATLGEMAAHLGLGSRGGALRVVVMLERGGHVRRVPGRHRTVEPLEAPPRMEGLTGAEAAWCAANAALIRRMIAAGT